jgi:hypothetical protein
MDANEITCPKCGHLNNYISEGCVKCGIIFSKYFEVQKREQQLGGAGAPEAAGKPEAAQAAVPAEHTESDTPEPKPYEDTITMDLNHPFAESQDPPAAETTPAEEETALESAEISIAVESETPLEKITDSPETKPDKAESPEHPQPVAAEAATSAESFAVETPSDILIPEIKTEKAPQAIEAPDEKVPETEKSEDSAPAEDVLNLDEPLEKDKHNVIPLKTESKPDKPEPLKTPDPSAGKKDAPAQAQAEPLPAEQPTSEPAGASPATEVDMPPAEDEAEILLEEVAEPVKTAETTKAEEQNQAELSKKEKATLAKAAIAKKQKLAQAKKLEALKKQKAAQAKAEALKRQKAAALKKQKLDARAEALKKQKAAQAETETAAQEAQAAVGESTEIQQPVMGKSMASNIRIMGLLKKYEGKTIGINYDNSADIKEAELVEANEEFFSVTVKEKNLQYSYPLQTLLSLVEGEDGVQTDTSESDTKFPVVIKVYPLVLF